MILLNNLNSHKTTQVECKDDNNGKRFSHNISNIELVFELIFDKFSKGLRVIGPLFAFALTLFVLIVAHSAFFIIIPYWTANYGIIPGTISFFTAIYILFSILFNYFLSVLVKPGSLADIKKSKFYKKNDPLSLEDDVVNLKNVFISKVNKQAINSKSNQNENCMNIKLRLKANRSYSLYDNINKEEEILKNANNEQLTKRHASYSIADVENKLDETQYGNNFEEETEIFRKHLDRQLDVEEASEDVIPESSHSQINDNTKSEFHGNLLENEFQLDDITKYYNINSVNRLNNKEESDADQLGDEKTDDKEYSEYKLRDCKYCKQPKPLRSHHCNICGYCVFKMDHHCPWINNCVGQNNHRYFILFLTHLMIGCLYVCLTAIPLVFNTNMTRSTEFNFICTLSLVGVFLMIFFNSWNWFLVLRGNTTIEYWTLKADIYNSCAIKDFSMPTWRENLYLVFGTTSLFIAIFIPSIKKLPISGLEWTKLAVPSIDFEIVEYDKNDKLDELNNKI